MNKTLKELEAELVVKERRHAALAAYEHSMANSIAVLKYVIAAEKRAIPSFGKKRRVVRNSDIRPFLYRASLFFDRLEHRYHLGISYSLFCRLICLRYRLMGAYYGGGKALSRATVLSYFKRERAGGG